MFRAVIGQAQCVDSECATAEVICQCRDRLAGQKPSAGILIAASGFDQKRVAAMVRDAFPDLPLVGCTTSGIFSSAMGLSWDSVALMLFVSDTVRFAAGLGRHGDAAEASREAAAMAMDAHPGETPALVFAFPDLLLFAPEEVVATLSDTFGCPVFGGFAGGENRTGMMQFFGGEAHTGVVGVLALYGPARAFFRVSNSWKPVGRRVRVDKVDGKQVQRIDGKTALQFYRDTLGPHGLPATEMPLAVFGEDERFSIRVPLLYNESDGSLMLSAAVPEGSLVRITEATRSDILEDVEKSLTELAAGLPPDFAPDAALAFSCDARRFILGLRAREELDLLRRILPPDLPILGFHAFGEISPLAPGDPALFHNCTLVTVLIGGAGGTGTLPGPAGPPCVPQCAADLMSAKDREIRFLHKQLSRSEDLITRLEHLRDIALGLQSRMNRELREANLTIQEKNRLLREALALAEEVQSRLLPRGNPTVPGFDIAGRSIYCDETGGDYYDYLAVPGADPGSVAVVVGDVSGHGVASALLMTTARALLRMRASMGGGPALHVADLNRLLAQDTADTGRFVTLFYLFIEPSPDGVAPGRIRYVRAGHDPALIYDLASDAFQELSRGGLPLGIVDDVAYEEFVFEGVCGGQVVTLGTDGIWEARNPDGEMFGKERLKRIIRERAQQPAQEIVEAVLRELWDFKRGLHAEDDVTLVVVKVL